MNEPSLLTKEPPKKISTKMIAVTGITAALYMVATLAIAPLSYGALQFRFSEILILLAFLDPGYAPGLILGCALANLFSPLGILDVVVGTMATACTMLFITRTKNLFLATLWPTIFCVFVGAELWIVSGLPFIPTTLSVMFGEFVVVSCGGYPLFKLLINQKKLIRLLKISQK